MALETEKQMKARIAKRVRNDILNKGWNFKGNGFRLNIGYSIGQFYIPVIYTCDLNYLKADIRYDTQEGWGTVAENTFSGENATIKCIEWTIEKLIEIYQKLNESVAPYAHDVEKYYFKLNNTLHLQGEKI